MIGHNITCSCTFCKKICETIRHGTRSSCLVPPGRLRVRGTILETSGTTQGYKRRKRMFDYHWAYTEGEPHATHSPRFARPTLRKQFSTHDTVDITIMFRFQLIALISPPPLRFAHAWFLTFYLFFPNLSSEFFLFRDAFLMLL